MLFIYQLSQLNKCYVDKCVIFTECMHILCKALHAFHIKEITRFCVHISCHTCRQWAMLQSPWK